MASYTIRDRRGTDSYHNRLQAASLYPNPRTTMQMRPRFYSLQDNSKAVDMAARSNMVSYSRELFATMGNLGGAILAKNSWSFQDGWQPIYRGSNQTWGEQAEAWLRDKWYSICNVKGPNFDFKTSLYLMGVSLDVDGDSLCILTSGRDGFPQIQFVAAHRIGQRSITETEVKAGRYRGNAITDGVITNSVGRPIAYRILGDAPADDYDISAQSAMLVTEPEWSDQNRGIPRLARAVLDCMDVQDIDFYLKRAVKLDSAQGVFITNQQGEADVAAPLYMTEEDTAPVNPTVQAPPSGLVVEQLNGGELMYLKAGLGEKVEPFRTDRPHTNVTDYVNRIERRCLFSLGFPIELLDPSKIGGASVRLIQEQARKSIKSRQFTGERVARFMCSFAIASAMNNELLPANFDDDWWNWSFTRPAAISVDNGNEASADRDSFKLCTASLSEIAAKKGIDWTELRTQVQKETEDLLTRAQDLADKFSITLDKALDLLSQRTPNTSALAQPDSLPV